MVRIAAVMVTSLLKMLLVQVIELTVESIQVNLAAIIRNEVNPHFLPLFVDYHRFIVMRGGASSGKSFSQGQKVIYKMITEPGHKYLIVRKVAKTLRHSVFSLLKTIISDWGVASFFKWNEGELYMRSSLYYKVKEGRKFNEIIFAGLDDVEKLKSIHGITDIWIEEASEISESDLDQLNLRLRGVTRWKKQITLTFNPISTMHWIKRRFFDQPLEGYFLHHSTYQHNEHLDPDTIKELENITDPYFKTVYVEGNWGVFGNVVFTDFVIEEFDYNENTLESVSTGMDFGTAHASAIIRLGFKDGELYVFDELYGKGWTNGDFIGAANEYWGDICHDWFIAADSAEPDRITEFQREGFQRLRAAKKGPGSLRYGVDFLCNYRIHIHATKCPNTAKEVQSFKRREDKNGDITEAFVEINDDCIAGMRYASEDLWDSYRGNVASYGLEALGL